VWRETQQKAGLDIELLGRLLDDHRDLLESVCGEEPGRTELLALSALLHSFYTGIENVFKRIALEIDGNLPTGYRSHSDLLVQMARPNEKRNAVISDELRLRLGEYMDFRHVFRHAYSFDLKWRKMAGLVTGCGETLNLVGGAVATFFGETEHD
jgi:hypothetical protein